MHQVLFKVFGFEVRSYGVLLVLGIVFAVLWSRRRASRWGIEPEKVFDATFWGVIPGILGARIGFILQEWDYYSKNPDKLWTFRFEGLTSFGGVIMALAGLLWFARRTKISAWAFLDVCAPPLLMAHVLGRVGCLLNGCCYGRQTTAWYGVRVSDYITTLFEPAQVFEGFMVMVGVGVILLVERKQRNNGTSISLAVIVWGLARFIYEFFRAGTIGEVARGAATSTYWGSLPVTQAHVAAFAMVLIGCAMLWIVSRKPKPEEK